MAESVATHIRDLRKKVIQESFQDFRQVDHRLEFVAKVRGVEYIDDAKASNVNSTWFALENMTRSVVWIAGGKTDDIDFSSMRNLVGKKVKHIVCLGKDNSAITEAFGDVVLLSPACPSFDLFESYQDKGMQFKRAVCEL